MLPAQTPIQRRQAARQAARRWPIAQDKPVDRARTIAQGLLRAIESAATLEEAQTAAAQLVERCSGWGETWLKPPAVPSGPWYTRDQVAQLGGVTPNAVTNWVARGYLTHYPQGFAEREVMDHLATRRTGTPTAARAPQAERPAA